MPNRLTEAQIHQHMRNLPGWTTDGQSLFYVQTFEDFVDAIAFVNQLIEPAEELGHHPDITIQYNRVSLQLTTHDAQGLTHLDFQLAHKILQL
ncbi:MAG: 4a-hydroxytetrahydrobiopterin dehydratase [Leptolyngbya sp. SIO1D8]|nr:4a-hydroxytetrahydrobiopterin dehydratase [Leptolyngbya sp. SIO1D8]